MTPLSDPLQPIHRAPTPHEVLQMRICDALIQYQAGKYASTPQNRIPARIVKAALEAFDPTVKLRFNPHGITGKVKLKPPCTHCGSTRVVSDGRLRYAWPRRWKCYGCGKGFEEAMV